MTSLTNDLGFLCDKSAHTWAIEKNNIMKNNIWNVGDEKLNHTKLEIAEIIKNKIDYNIVVNTELSHDEEGRNYFVDYSKIREIGFKAKETLNEGIDNLIKIYKN